MNSAILNNRRLSNSNRVDAVVPGGSALLKPVILYPKSNPYEQSDCLPGRFFFCFIIACLVEGMYAYRMCVYLSNTEALVGS